jgi:phosphoribosylaminoimidazolecarboxamide formyltransferase/IMP cyclohydrolase
LSLELNQVQLNRYGENPHQQGGLYAYEGEQMPFAVLHGKEMSYNNWLDLDGAWQSAQDFPEPTVSIIKHGNPCGLASAAILAEAYEKALASDPVSAFGGIIAVNRVMDAATAKLISSLFVEVVAAPEYAPDALDIFMAKKNLRIVQPTGVQMRPLSLRSIYGGVLVQEVDLSQEDMDAAKWKIVSQKQRRIWPLRGVWRVG